MKDISKLSTEFDKFIDNLVETVISYQDDVTNDMNNDAKNRIEIPEEARNKAQFMRYENSLKKQTPEIKGNEITSSVYSNLLVGGDSKWADVPVGAFLEWGTGPLGESSNLYEHGYPYTTNEPWDMHTWLQFIQTGNWGIIARPHLYPAFLHSIPKFRNSIRKAVKDAWMK